MAWGPWLQTNKLISEYYPSLRRVVPLNFQPMNESSTPLPMPAFRRVPYVCSECGREWTLVERREYMDDDNDTPTGEWLPEHERDTWCHCGAAAEPERTEAGAA